MDCTRVDCLYTRISQGHMELESELALEPSCLLLQDYKRHNTLPEGQLLISRCNELDPDRSCSQTPTKNGKNGLPGP